MTDGLGIPQLPVAGPGAGIERLRVPGKDSSAEEVKKVAGQLEGVFFSMVVKEMRKSMMSDDLFGSGPEAEQYAGLFDQMMGEHMAQTGGLGIARMVMESAQAARESIRPEALEARLAEIAEARARAATEEPRS